MGKGLNSRYASRQTFKHQGTERNTVRFPVAPVEISDKEQKELAELAQPVLWFLLYAVVSLVPAAAITLVYPGTSFLTHYVSILLTGAAIALLRYKTS